MGTAFSVVADNVSFGLTEDDDTGTSVEEEGDGSAGVRFEAETEEGVGSVRDDLTVDEGAAIVGRAVHMKDGAIRAEDERSRAHDRDESVVAEASLGEYVFAWVSKDDGGGEVGSVRRSVVGHIRKDGWA